MHSIKAREERKIQKKKAREIDAQECACCLGSFFSLSPSLSPTLSILLRYGH